MSLSPFSIFRTFIGGCALIIGMFLVSVTASAAPHSELLSNCASSISELYPNAEMKLERKSKSGTDHKLWVSVKVAESNGSNEFRAYCEGKTRSGAIEKFGINVGKWKGGEWISGAEAVLRENLASK